MKILVITILLLSSILGGCQVTKQGKTSLEDIASKEIRLLKKEGVNNFLILERGCQSCDNKSSEDCNCLTGEITASFIFFLNKNEAFRRAVECCGPSVTRSLPDDFFRKVDSISKEVILLEKKQTATFYPPIATDQPYYKVVYQSSIGKIDFSLYDGQLADGSEENKAWTEFPVFVIRQKLLSYLLTAIN